MTGTIKKWAVADGRDALGIIQLDASGKFVAVDFAGQILGKFATLLGDLRRCPFNESWFRHFARARARQR
jgi:hypothetical protein